MQRVRPGPLGPLVVLLTFSAFACTSTSNPPASSTFATPSTSIDTVTTETPPSSEPTVESSPVAAPTIVVPTRPPGLDGLQLTDSDLEGIAILRPSVLKVLPHDRTAITESLALLSDTQLLESTGLYGRSSRRMINLADGDLTHSVALVPELYGSGISIVGEGDEATGMQFSRLEGFVQQFSLTDLSLLSERRFSAKVNGACTVSPSQTAISTAGGDIHILENPNLETTQTITPQLRGEPLPPLTDLSCDGSTIWAILGATGAIAQISIDDGAVVALTDLSGLTPAGLANADVLSGLTYRPSTGTWFVTGKRWDVLYEISLNQ